MTEVHLLAVACFLGALQNGWFFWVTTRRALTTRDQLLTLGVWRLVCASAYALLGLFLLHAGVFVYLVDLVTR